MGKAKTKKAKVDFKQLLLNKGEYFALGAAGLFMFILLLSGLSTSSQDPEKIAKGLKAGADQVASRIRSQDVPSEDVKNTEMPVWLQHKNTYPTVNVTSFPVSGPQFDPTGKPDTRRDKPLVLPIMGDAQVNLVKIPFKAFDIATADKNGETALEIGVISEKTVDLKMDADERKKFADRLKGRVPKAATQPGAGQPGGFGPGFGPGGPGAMGPGGMGPGGMGPGGIGMGRGGRFDAAGKRTETSVKYIPLEDLDAAMGKGMVPAMTVVPLRGVIVHMEVPYKAQLEEIKRALRLASTAEATSAVDGNGKVIYENGSIYMGYEVERQVSAPGPDGQFEVETPWSPYPFEQNYQRLINSRKMADIPEDPSLTAFIRPDMNLVLPLPQLVTELGHYPPLSRLPNINKSISKLREKNITPAQVSETLNRLKGGGDANSVYQNQNGEETGGAIFGPGAMGPGGMRPGRPGALQPGPGPGPGPAIPGKNGGKLEANEILDDIDYLLLRFIDVDIEKGKTYQYRIRLKMRNPNFNRPADVSNSIYAEKPILYSPWTEIKDPVFIPPEDHLYAIDVGSFRKSIEEAYPGDSIKSQRERERYQPRETQVMVEMCKWMMEVRPETGKTREPVGAWVVADIPVGRGEFVGRKQFIKLPLWSSERQMFTLREMPTTSKTSSKEAQPKGWMMEFATPDILADFSGGRVFTKVGDRKIFEDAASELLVVSPDGRLTVLKSQVDEANSERADIVSTWTKWVADVEKRGKDGGRQDNDPNGLAPKPGN